MIQKSDGPDDPIFHTENPFNPQCVPGEIPTFDAHPTPIQEYQRPIHASLQRASSLTAWSDTLAFQRCLYNQQRELWNLEFKFYVFMEVSRFPFKRGYPQIKVKPFLVLKLTVLRIPQFKKPPSVSICLWPLGFSGRFFLGKRIEIISRYKSVVSGWRWTTQSFFAGIR